MTVIRLTRMGRNKKPFYRIVVTDSRKRRDSGWIESIGYFNPVVEPQVLKIDGLRSQNSKSRSSNWFEFEGWWFPTWIDCSSSWSL
mgnify:CR=1 FL=1